MLTVFMKTFALGVDGPLTWFILDCQSYYELSEKSRIQNKNWNDMITRITQTKFSDMAKFTML